MALQDHIRSLLQEAIQKAQKTGTLPAFSLPPLQITRTRDAAHGDLATNCALVLAKSAQCKPRDIAEQIVQHLPASDLIERAELAGPGFINFYLSDAARFEAIYEALDLGEDYGRSDLGKGKRIHMEFVSANPTGPLHVGHGRGAAYGACVYALLKHVGYHVHADYYVNDAGRQMRILALSTWIRYLQCLDEKVSLPEKAYQGDYIIDVAKQLIDAHHTRFYQKAAALEAAQPTIDPVEKPEAYLDALVEMAIHLLGKTDFELIRQTVLNHILEDIRDDLSAFGVEYDEWFRESRLIEDGQLDAGIAQLKAQDTVYEKEGALWFRATQFGDEKDRVLIRANGQPTYFASDVAYHLYKYNQGYDQIIDIFGADHHGYTPRINAFLKGLGKDPSQLTVLFVQFAILYRGKEKVSMSTRGGDFVTLRALREEVGNDAARYFYIMRKPEQHLDFDLSLATSRTNENPVYYIQYAHARIASVWRQLREQSLTFDMAAGKTHLSALNSAHETELLRQIAHFPEIIEAAATQYAPHTLAYFLQDFANAFHSYYNASKFLVDDASLRNARLCLIAATQQVLRNGLRLLGLSAPDAM